MKKVKIGQETVDGGRPRICLPIMAMTKEEAVTQAQQGEYLPCSLLELRIDCLAGKRWRDVSYVAEIVDAIKKVSTMPVILTLRTRTEGGFADIQGSDYYDLLRELANVVDADAMDVEPFDTNVEFHDERLRYLVGYIHSCNKKVILSSHETEYTPEIDVMVRRLWIMNELGADISKLAVTASSQEDVINLLAAAAVMNENYGKKPFVAISMGKIGRPSRVCAGEFGSCITFAAPLGQEDNSLGQMGVEALADCVCQYYGE